MDEYVPVQAARIYPVKVNTNQLINEFNQVLDSVELTHLTPPETPPHTPPQAPYEACLQDSKVYFPFFLFLFKHVFWFYNKSQ